MGIMAQEIQMVILELAIIPIQEVIIQVILEAPIIPALELIILEYPIHQLQKAHLKFQKKLSKILTPMQITCRCKGEQKMKESRIGIKGIMCWEVKMWTSQQ